MTKAFGRKQRTTLDTPENPYTLAQWRRSVAELYAQVRRSSAAEPLKTWRAFRESKNDLLRQHPQSPLDNESRRNFRGLDYFPYNPVFRTKGTIRMDIDRVGEKMDLARDGLLHYTKVGVVDFKIEDQKASLNIYWINGYGGGIFLPFQDATSGVETYDGGRYLYDTIKGVDLGVMGETMLLDFNYAYNPSCAYDEKWVCPLSPKENRLALAIEAGEKAYSP